MLTVQEKVINPKNGYAMLALGILLLLVSTFGIVAGTLAADIGEMVGFGIAVLILSVCVMVFSIIFLCGLKTLRPNEAYVFTLFGKYYGTVHESGFFWINPFVSPVYTKDERPNPETVAVTGAKAQPAPVAGWNRKVSTKIQTLVNDTQKVNDLLGNPVIIGAIVVWKVDNPTKAVFMVDNYREYLSSQADSIIRNVARLYPYDVIDDETEVQTLRASASEIAERMQDELQAAVADAGLEVIDVRLNQLSYAPEIAAAMLQRQQAVAVIAARQKIVEGAVSMVKMALDQLKSDEIVELDEERKAQMVSNLLVVLCGNKDAQPILNSGSIY